ncbi:MAG: phage minor capsid protein, partial [Planctomycetota bacterium]
ADAPDWVQKKLAQMAAYRKRAEAIVATLEAETIEGVSTAMHAAYARGGSAAVAELTGLSLPAEAGVFGTHALEALVAETQGALLATHTRILRSTMDAYRSVIAETANEVLLGTQTRRQAAQAALNRFAEKGITGFVDKAGRGWSLETYTEMAMRTGTAHAAVQGQTDRLEANGMDLVIISDAPRECPLCRPHEGKVYSISGTDPKYSSLDSAREGGLFHPGCRHSASLYQPEVTRPSKRPTADPEGYEAGQKQRYLERQVRASKRMEAAAIDDVAKRQAQVRIRAYQAKLREHVAANDLKRLSYREQIGKAH